MVGLQPYSMFEQIFITAVSGYSTGDAVNFKLTTERMGKNYNEFEAHTVRSFILTFSHCHGIELSMP